MHRIDPPGHAAGLYQDGNPQIGQQGTVMDAAWANDVQENICTVIEDAGVGLVKGAGEQLKLAIAAMIAAASATVIAATRVPVATVIMVDGPGPAPAGYVDMDTEYLRADYPALVAHYDGLGRLIAGSTLAHFRTPDYQGLFARAASTDATVDPDGPRDAGDTQADAFASHSHSVSPPVSNSEGGAGNTVTGSTGTGEVLTTYSTATTGGTETRPVNVAFSWFIKT